MDLGSFQSFLAGSMKERGWNIPRLSEAADIADPVIRRWFGKKPKRPSDGNLRKIARALDVPVEQLLRMCGYLPLADIGDTTLAGADPRLANVIVNWERLPESVRDAMSILASAGASKSAIKALETALCWFVALLCHPVWQEESPLTLALAGA